MELRGQSALVTGGGSGVGLAIATALAKQGVDVGIAGRNASRLEAAAAEHPGLVPVPGDVSSAEGAAALAAAASERLPEMGILVNNAGTAQLTNIAEHDAAAVAEAEIGTNYLGPVRLIGALLPQLRQRPAAAIVNVSSALAWAPAAPLLSYSATKAALHSFTLGLRYQLEDTAVSVIEVLPPWVDTSMVEQIAVAKVSAEQVAAATVRGLRRDRKEVTLGIGRPLRIGAKLAPHTVANRVSAMTDKAVTAA